MNDLSAWWLRGVVALVLAVFGGWLVSRTEWVEVVEPLPLADELARDGTLIGRRFLERLGARTRVVQTLTPLPPPRGTLVLSARHWKLALPQEEQLRDWVRGGGHLVVDRTVIDDLPKDGWLPLQLAPRDRKTVGRRDDPCRLLKGPEGQIVAWGDERGFVACAGGYEALQPAEHATWSLLNEDGEPEALRRPVGQGRVTGFAPPFNFAWQSSRAFSEVDDARLTNFSNRGLLEGDNAALLATLVDVKAGDEVWFLHQVDRPPLPLWAWQQVWPALLLALAALALALWRAGLRFGPLQLEPPSRRRSLATQIEGLADFLFSRHSPALHTAAVRALREAAAAQLPGWNRLTPAARTLALARTTGLPADALERAQEGSVVRNGVALSDTLALLETARRSLLAQRGAAGRRPPTNPPPGTTP
jgi:hypothetical protein